MNHSKRGAPSLFAQALGDGGLSPFVGLAVGVGFGCHPLGTGHAGRQWGLRNGCVATEYRSIAAWRGGIA